MEALGLAYIALGMLTGASLGWALSRAKVVSDSSSLEEELIRARALLEFGDKAEEKTHQQMLDGFRIAAGEAFSQAVEAADKQKESSFKKATDDLKQDLGEYIEAIQEAKDILDVNKQIMHLRKPMLNGSLEYRSDKKHKRMNFLYFINFFIIKSTHHSKDKKPPYP